jgi:hypothetical protein
MFSTECVLSVEYVLCRICSLFCRQHFIVNILEYSCVCVCVCVYVCVCVCHASEICTCATRTTASTSHNVCYNKQVEIKKINKQRELEVAHDSLNPSGPAKQKTVYR